LKYDEGLFDFNKWRMRREEGIENTQRGRRMASSESHHPTVMGVLAHIVLTEGSGKSFVLVAGFDQQGCFY
jgi:hypothetical protein